MKDIIIIGSSGHAKVVIDIIERQGEYKIIGLIDRFRDTTEETLGYSILGKEEDLPELISKYSVYGVIVAIGDNFIRSKVSTLIINLCPDITFISAIHPDTSISKYARIGDGSVIVAGVIVNANAVIGKSCILNTASSVGHDAILNDFSSIGPGVRVAGGCNIGELSSIGIGAVIIEKVNIGEGVVIGASSTVTKDITSFVIAYGTPAKIIRKREIGEKYLK